MKSRQAQRLNWLLPLALYAAFLWRSLYSTKFFPLGLLDWLVPTVALSLWVVFRLRSRDAWPQIALDLPMLAWLAVTLLASVLSPELRRGLFTSWETYLGILILYLLVDAVRRGWSPVLWRVLYLVAAVICIIGAVEFLSWYFGWPLLSRFQEGWLAISGITHPFPPKLYRIGLALVNNTALSAFMALLIPPALGIVLTTRNREVRIGLSLWLIAAGVTILLSLSRGGFVALGVSLPLLLLGGTRDPRFHRWWSGFQSPRRRTMLMAAAAVVLVFVIGVGFLLTSRLALHAKGDAVRINLWRSAATMFVDHPMTGVGPGAYGIALRSYRDPLLASDRMTTAHNLYLNVAAEMGLPGLLVAAVAIVVLAWRWWQSWWGGYAGSSRWWRFLAMGAALAGLAAQSMVDTFVESAILLTAAFFVAQIVAYPIPAESVGQKRRWPWCVALLLLIVGAAGMAWDAWAEAKFVRSIALTQRGAVEDALAAAETARARDPAMPLYACHTGYLYGLQAAEGDALALQVALDQYRECTADTAVPELADQLNSSALLWQAGCRAEARSATRTLTEEMPLQPAAWLNNGLLAEMEGDRQEAVSSYRQVLMLDPEFAGSPFWVQGVRAEWWDEIVQSDKPASEVGWRWQALLAAGRLDEAAVDIEAWLESYPNDIVAVVGLGQALIGLERPAEALALLDRAIEQAPSDAQGYLVRGEAWLESGQYGEAERDFRTALFLKPSVTRARLGLAHLALDRGQEDLAMEQYAQALRPQVLPQSAYVVLYGRMGWPVLLPQVARIGYRQDGKAALEWGSLLESRGDTEAAIQVYKAALDLDPFLEEVRQRLERLGEE